MNKLRVLCVTSLLLFCNVCSADVTEVTIRQGKLKGAINVQGNYAYFFGIPYASVIERFQEPSDPPTWNNTLIATQEQAKCIQYSTLLKEPVGQEDCLFLNVYKPLTKLEQPAAVIVFLPGGGYTRGSNTDLLYNPKYFIRKHVIVVTVNFRLGAFGLLCLNKKGATGNMTLKDQKAALKWVRDNIIQFGGNPNCVTLVGNSSGASSINYFLFNNSTDGLFHRAIIQGGTMLSPHKFDENPIDTASAIAIRMGYNTSDPGELLEIYKKADAHDIILASHEDLTNNAKGLYVFKPCLENSSISENAVITESIIDSLKSTKLDPSIDVILGYTNKEGLCWASSYNSTGLKNIKQNIGDYIPHNFHFEDDNQKLSFIEDIKNFYFENSSSGDDVSHVDLTDFFSDCFVMYPSLVIAEALLMNGNNMYNYYFEYDSQRNINKLVLKGDLSKTPGAVHGDELYYMFDQVIYKSPPIPRDRNMIDKITSLWTNFAKTGVPSPKRKHLWERSDEEIVFLKINERLKMISMPNKKRMDFWKSAHEKYSSK